MEGSALAGAGLMDEWRRASGVGSSSSRSSQITVMAAREGGGALRPRRAVPAAGA
jgi:hypothetical protein